MAGFANRTCSVRLPAKDTLLKLLQQKELPNWHSATCMSTQEGHQSSHLPITSGARGFGTTPAISTNSREQIENPTPQFPEHPRGLGNEVQTSAIILRQAHFFDWHYHRAYRISCQERTAVRLVSTPSVLRILKRLAQQTSEVFSSTPTIAHLIYLPDYARIATSEKESVAGERHQQEYVEHRGT